MSEPWLETWHVGSAGYIYDEPDESNSCIAIAIMFTNSGGKSKLVAAAPDMCRALLAVEWGKTILGYCHACSRNSEWPHASGCPVDAALTKCGLATQEQRDEARKELGL